MSAYDDRFRAALIEDVTRIHDDGLGDAIAASTTPALAALAEALKGENDSRPDFYSRAIKATLIDAIDGIQADERRSGAQRQKGLTDLLGIGEYPGGDLTRRRDDAAESLGYRNGESLRRATWHEDVPGFGRRVRLVVEMLLEALAERLIALADEHGFFYRALDSWSTYYPDRPLYDYNSLSWEYGRSGATQGGPVFNSFINTPSYGDEPAFFDAQRGDLPIGNNYDPVRDVTLGSKTVVLRMYVHNMAWVYADDPYSSTAHGARVRIALPTAIAQVLRARAYIWADNADAVEDTVDLIGDEPFRVAYVPGSAALFRGNYEYPLSDGIVGEEGALIGHSIMDGIFPAGNQFEYAAFVKATVNIITADAPD